MNAAALRGAPHAHRRRVRRVRRIGSSVGAAAALALALLAAFSSSLGNVSVLRDLHRREESSAAAAAAAGEDSSAAPSLTEPRSRPPREKREREREKNQTQGVQQQVSTADPDDNDTRSAAASPPPLLTMSSSSYTSSDARTETPRRNTSVVSYSVYGNDTKYLIPLLYNVRRLVPKYYPGWQIRIYHDDSVPPDFLDKLRRRRRVAVPNSDINGGIGGDVDVDVRLVNVKQFARDPSSEPSLNASWSSWMPRINPMTWRLLVASDPTVSMYVIRDSDSVPNSREKAAVDEWLSAPGSPPFHLMHDHPRHYSWNQKNITMLGCCWGGLGGKAAPDMADLLRSTYDRYRSGRNRADPTTFRYSDDQDFLHEKVYPAVLALGPGGSVRHNSFECEKNDGVAFPTAGEWDVSGYDFVGEVMRLTPRPRDGGNAVVSGGGGSQGPSGVGEDEDDGDGDDDIGYDMRGREENDSGACWLNRMMQVGKSWRKKYRRCLRRRVDYGGGYFRNATDIMADTGMTPLPAPSPRGCAKTASMTNREKMIAGGGGTVTRKVRRGATAPLKGGSA